MARTRQKAKQRKAKRLEQERKAQGTTGQKPPSNPAEQAVVDQAAAYELGDVLEEAGGDANVAARRIEEEQSEEAVKPVRAPTRLLRRSRERAAEPGTTEPERAKPERGQRERAKPDRRDGRARGARAERKREPGQRGRVLNFFVQVWAELRRVQWPSRSQVTQATAVVLVFCLIAGAYLAILDFGFAKLMKIVL
jgi:preprotein translocase subunit SecE